MSNQKQAPTVPQSRYPQNSYLQRPLTSQRTDAFHVTQQQYGPPPTQTGNQGPAIRAAMAPTGPPTQASTPPNSELKVPPVPQSMNLFVQPQAVRGASQNFFAPRGPPQQTQTQRMPNRQVPQQQVFPAQSSTPYMQVQPPVPQMYCMPYAYGGTQRPIVPQIFSGQYAFTTFPPTQPTPQYINYTQFLPRAQAPSIVSTPQNLQQPPPPQTIAQNLAQNTQQHGSQKRRRAKAIPIIDPISGVDKLSEVYDEVESHPPSGESSARQTPQPPYIPNKDIQSAFSKQVNMVINQDKMEDIDHSPVPVMEQHLDTHPPMAPVFQTLNTAVHSNPGRNDCVQFTKGLQVPQKEFVPSSAAPTAKESTPVVSANADVPELTINKPKDRESPAKNRKQREHAIKEKEVKDTSQAAPEKRPKEELKGIKEEPKPKEPTIAMAAPAPFPKDVKDTIPPREDKKSSGRKDKPEPPKFSPVQDIVSDHGAAPVCAPVLDNSKTKQKNVPKQQPPMQQQGFKPPVPVPVPVPQTQPAKPNNKTNKMKELNMKGANKEGTDMDAFSDNHTVVETPITNNSNVNNNPTIENNVSVVIAEVDSNKTAEPDVPTIKHESKPLPKAKIDVTDIVKDIPKPFVPPVEAADETDKIDMSNEKLVQAKNEVNSKNNSSEIDSNVGDIKQALRYKDDQWSPLNQGGKKIYDREFLLALRNDPKSKRKPDNLLDVVVQEDRGKIGDISRYPLGGRTTDFAPQFSAPNYSGKSSSQRGAPPKRNSQQGKISGNSKNNKPNILRLSIREDVKLHEAENAWRPARLSNIATLTEDEKRTENLYKKVRGILNKLTPQKFDALLQQIKSLPIDTTERLQGVIDLVFEKAVDEPNFSVAYANMCSQLALIQVPTSNKKEGEFVNFRKLLITRCQLEFEKNSLDESSRNEKLIEIEECTDPEKKKELQLMLEEEDRRLRRKSVGNIRFIGELFKKNMLTNNIMMRCLDNLLTNKDEESLECLCKLLSTIGEELEKRKVSLENIFSTVKEIADRKHGKISSRVRFMLQDVIDLRSAKWVPRRQDTNPKTIDQIQKEANDEQLNIQAMNSGPHTPRKDDRNSSTADRKQRRNNVSDSEGWTTSQSRGARPGFSVQCDKLKNKPPQIDEPLGSSQMFGQWGRGSNLKTNTQSSLANMYAPLENMGNDVEKRNSMAGSYRSKDPYTSKGPSLERNYKHSSYEDGRGSRSGSQHRSHDGSHRSTPISNSQASMPKQMPPTSSSVAATAKVPQELTPEQLELKVKNILEEYLNDCCTIVACDEDIRENIPELAYVQFVSYGYNNVLERSTTARLKLSGLFSQLIKMNRLSLDSYCIGLEDVLGQADDLTIDIPMIWGYLGEIIAPLLYENTLPLRRLYKSCNVLIRQGHAAKLLAATFKLVVGEKGPNYLTSLWKTSELSLSDFMPAERVDDFINENQFEFLVGGANTSTCQSILTYEQIYNKLLEFFVDENSFDDIINWITVNVGDRTKEKEFIRVLATAIFENSTVKKKFNVTILRKHYNLLSYFVDGTLEYELQILYALQAFVNKLEVPQGLYLLAFTTLYDDTVLSHDSFLNWETSRDPAEQDGKGVAIKQLTSFFTNLKEAEDEESSSEDA